MTIQLKNVTKIYNKKHKALNGVSLHLNPGEIVGMLGVNGSGKSTTSNILAGLHTKQSGDLFHNGARVETSSDLAEYRGKIGYCPQNATLNEDLSVQDNLFTSALYFDISKEDANKALDKIIKQFKLQPYLDKLPTTLSGGWVKRVMIARALIHDPDLIILDEPTVALDPGIRELIWKIIEQLKKDGKTILLVTHYLEEAERLCDRVYVMDKGKIVAEKTKENLRAKELEGIFMQLEEETKEVENA